MKYFSMPRLTFFKSQWTNKLVWNRGVWNRLVWKGFCGFLVTLAVISQISNHLSLVYSRTDSLPYRLFLNLKQVTPKRGQYTWFESPWYGGRVIKKVIGTAGDSLFYDKQGNLWIARLNIRAPSQNALLKIGKPKTESKDGRVLTPIKPGTIPEGKVFVSGNHERSFDSRYEELGLIPEKDLQGCLLALA